MPADALFISVLAVSVWMTLGCVVSFVRRRGDVADPWWAAGLGLLGAWGLGRAWFGSGWCGTALFPGFAAPPCDVVTLTVLALPALALFKSSLRLFSHLVRRFPAAEDFRYADWRRDWGASYAWRAPLQIWALQGVLLWTAALPVTAARPAAWESWHAWALGVGLAVWAAGLEFESVADRQLARFRADPANKGKLLASGVWAWSRHPNYFGEALAWWGIALAALPSAGTLALVSPILMTLMLRFVSGVPMLDRAWASRPGFDAWTRRTNAFFPWFPKP